VLHEPVLWLVSSVFVAAVGLQALEARAFVAALAPFLVAFPIVLALSWLTHLGIELPFLNIRRRAVGSRATARAATTSPRRLDPDQPKMSTFWLM
jgi:peptidoglycan/LPS O-acetylase OafA/YrhL